METHELRRWADGLRAARAGAAAGRVPDAGDRTSRAAFLRWKGLYGRDVVRPQVTLDRDARLWWALADEAAVDALDGMETEADGPLFTQGDSRAIEVWTETELSALQALWWLARRGGGARVRDRMIRAARWHLDNTQPDNATNRPWAIPVYLELARGEGVPEALLYAETLLHNARAGRDRVEPFSAAILLDAADAVDLMITEG